MGIIDGRDITYRYDELETPALAGATLTIEKGEFIALLGANGCGKSTLARHLDALLELQEGELTVAGIDVLDETRLWELRRLCGLVFQNPDNQFVSNIVEEDICFGLENYDTPMTEVPKRVKYALAQVGMEGYEKRATHTLSGGQKQRIALAGVLAIQPDIIVFDEATSMLDPKGRDEVMACMRRLHEMGKTIVMITHYVEETTAVDKIILMKEGKVKAVGTPKEILSNLELLHSAKVDAPIAVRMYYDLQREGIQLSKCPLTEEALVEELCQLR